MKPKHMSTHNTKGFFDGMKEGDLFTYNFDYYDAKEMKAKAAKAGLLAEYCGPDTAEYKKYGGCTMRITGRVPQSELEFDAQPPNASDAKEAYLAATHLMTLKLNRDEPAYRASWLISQVLKGTLSATLRAEHARMKDREFEHYYGATLQHLLVNAWRLEHLENDAEGINAAQLIATAVSGVCPHLGHNFAHLLAAGIPGEIGDWATGFRGTIIRIDRIPLSDRLDAFRTGEQVPFVTGLRIVTSRETSGRKETKYYASTDWHVCFDTYEGALLFGMFGKDHHRTVETLYRAARKEE